MDSYNFTYKDVLKRYERIINKPSKFELRLLATILLIITIVNISSLCFAAEEESVSYQQINNLDITQDHNYFTSNDYRNVVYFETEKGYIYHITNNYGSISISVAYSSSVPSLNEPYEFIAEIQPTQSYSIIPSSNYVYLSISKGSSDNFTITKEKIENYEGAVSELVENVGISQIWDIFDTGIGFVGVVVLVAFGIFLIVLAIKKVSKGKSEF